jgi:hypothetical protein
MMMFVVTPSLDSIEYKFNSKSIKFPKLHKVPTLEAININKPWSEWKERLRNFGVKPPKRGIELGWVTRGTRPKNLLLLAASPAKPTERGELRELGEFGELGDLRDRKPSIFFLSFPTANNQKKYLI